MSIGFSVFTEKLSQKWRKKLESSYEMNTNLVDELMWCMPGFTEFHVSFQWHQMVLNQWRLIQIALVFLSIQMC